MLNSVARTLALMLGCLVLLASAACSDRSATPVVVVPAPDSFRVLLETTKGDIIIEVTKAWAPKGAERFHELVSIGFFDDNAFFRVLPGFIAQFGASGDKKLNEAWDEKLIADDPVVQKNVKGTLSFAHHGADTRSHQLFINLKDNASLDTQGFAPIGRVVDGMDVAAALHDEAGETPKYHLIATLGNSYLKRMFPKLDYIKKAMVLGGPATMAPAASPRP